MDPSPFFATLARSTLQNTPPEQLETQLAAALESAFTSGMASTLTAVVSAIEGLRVPQAGMVLFRVPAGLPDAALDAFRRDMQTITGLLEGRLGWKPIILVVPEGLEAQVVDFAAEEAGEVVPFPGQLGALDALARRDRANAPGSRRIVALDTLALRNRILNVLPDDIGTVTVFATGSAVVNGSAQHDIRVTLDNPDPHVITRLAATIRDTLWDAALLANAQYTVLLSRAGEVAPSLGGRPDEWTDADSARFIVGGHYVR